MTVVCIGPSALDCGIPHWLSSEEIPPQKDIKKKRLGLEFGLIEHKLGLKLVRIFFLL